MKLYPINESKPVFSHQFQVNDPKKNNFIPGDVAPESGIYMVIHSHECRPSHSVTVLWGEIFPECSKCGDEVSFQPVISAVHVREHDLFVELS